MFDDPRSGMSLTNDFGEAMNSMFAEKPSSSGIVLCRPFRIEKMTCLRILHEKLGLKKFHLRWVPYTILINKKSERGSYSKPFFF
jgi:hypothetical protein